MKFVNPLNHLNLNYKEIIMNLRKNKAIIILSTFAIMLMPILIIGIDGLTDNLSNSDLAVIFGSKVEHTGEPSKRLKARLDAGIKIYQKGFCKKILVSGGIGKEKFDEALIMKEYLISKGVPSNLIIVDNNGYNTYQTALYCANISKHYNWNKVIVVTQFFHISRARLALKRFGIEEVGTVHARYFEIRDIYSIIREIFGYVKYFFRDYTNPKSI